MQCSVVVVVVARPCVSDICTARACNYLNVIRRLMCLCLPLLPGSAHLCEIFNHYIRTYTHTHLAVCRPVVSASQSVKAYPAERSVCAAWSAASYEIKYNTPGHWHAHHDAAAAVLRMFARRGDSLARTQTLNG